MTLPTSCGELANTVDRKLHLPMRRKIAVSLVFLLGAFTIGISLARIAFFVQVGKVEYTDPDRTCKCWQCLYSTLR